MIHLPTAGTQKEIMNSCVSYTQIFIEYAASMD